MEYMKFNVSHSDGVARRGELTFARGTVQTPAFMPVGTYGTVKGMLPRDIEEIGADIIIYLRIGDEQVYSQAEVVRFTKQGFAVRFLSSRLNFRRMVSKVRRLLRKTP